MATGAYNENAYEKAVMELLAKEGWQVEYGPDIERDYGEATWDEVLREQIFYINRDTSSDALCARASWVAARWRSSTGSSM